MKVTERRLVYQDWYETEYSKTGWDSHGWYFDDGVIGPNWEVVEHLQSDKFGNPIVGIAERKTTI